MRVTLRTIILILLWAACGIAWAQDRPHGVTTQAPEPTTQPVVGVRRPHPTDRRGPAPSGGEAPKVEVGKVEIKKIAPPPDTKGHGVIVEIKKPVPLDPKGHSVTAEIKKPTPLGKRGPKPATRRQRTHGQPASTPNEREGVRTHIGPTTPLDTRGPGDAGKRDRTHGHQSLTPDDRARVQTHLGPITPIEAGAQMGETTNLKERITAPTVQAWKLDESGQKTNEPAIMEVLESGSEPSRQRPKPVSTKAH